jgi:hypothetical protein
VKDNTEYIDAQIRERLTARLDGDDRTAEAAIDVICQQGIVTLQGRVKDHAVRQAAEEIAAAQSGVIDVINDLEVGPQKGGKGLLDAPEAAIVDRRTPYVPGQYESEEKT